MLKSDDVAAFDLQDEAVSESGGSTARPDASLPGGVSLLLLTLAGLAALRIALGYVSFPLGSLQTINAILAVLFLATPIIGLFFASNARWSWQTATLFTVGGITVQAAAIFLGMRMDLAPSAAGILVAIAQMALACWCVGLGGLLATLIKEKNIILPIAIFLAAYDFFLVLTPWGFTQKLLKVAQPVFTRVAAQIPSVSAHPTHGLAQPSAYVGMADLVFLAMFFIALFRFRMRTRSTLYAVLPALVIYLLIVQFFGGYSVAGFSLSALPAMVPIGLAVLIVNWREFELKNDEKVATLALGIIAIAFLTFAATRPRPQAAPERKAPVRGRQAPAG